MPAAYNTCIKCCVIKLFFYLHFWGAGSLTRQGDTIKPASAIHSGAVAFCVPRPTSHTISPRESVTLGPSSAVLGSVGGGAVSILMAVSFQILGEPTSQHLAIGIWATSRNGGPVWGSSSTLFQLLRLFIGKGQVPWVSTV